jgi:hypothetical protein
MEPTPLLQSLIQGGRNTLETEVIVDTEEEAREEGRRSYELLMAFIGGFGEARDD